MTISPDQTILWQRGPLHVKATVACTWLTMALLTLGCWLVTRRLSGGPALSRWQSLLEER